MNKRQK